MLDNSSSSAKRLGGWKRSTRLRVKVVVGVALSAEGAVVATLLQGIAMVAVAVALLPEWSGDSERGQRNPRLVADRLRRGGLTADAA